MSGGNGSRGGAPQQGLHSDAGEFVRDSRYITDRITADGRDGWPVEPGRRR